MIRRSMLALTALVLVLALTACGADDDGHADAPPTSESTEPPPTSTAPTEPTEPTQPTEAPATPEPGTVEADAADDWVELLDTLIDPSVAPADRLNEVDEGDDLAPLLREIDTQLAGFETEFRVLDARVAGADGVASVKVLSEGERFEGPPTAFVLVDGEWLLTHDGACGLFQLAGIRCP